MRMQRRARRQRVGAGRHSLSGKVPTERPTLVSNKPGKTAYSTAIAPKPATTYTITLFLYGAAISGLSLSDE